MTNQIQQLLKPLSDCPVQSYLGTGIHTLGLLGWILPQVGRADVYVSTFSTSEEFLSGFLNLRRKELVNRAVLLADLKACRKTVKLNNLMAHCFDIVYLGQNHSKVVLIQSMSGQTVSVISSQNQTYGGRAECTMVTTFPDVYQSLFLGYQDIINNSVKVHGLYQGTTAED